MSAIKPVRLQLSRRKGFDLQRLSSETNGLPAVKVARPSKWGNPYKIGEPIRDVYTGRKTGELDAAGAVEKFRHRFCTPYASADIVRALRGKNLACWCSQAPCHADVLLELANAPIRCEPVAPSPPQGEQ